MNYISFALGAALFYSLSGISGKIAATHTIKGLPKLLFWSNITALLFVPLLWIQADRIAFPVSLGFFLFVLAFSIGSALTWQALRKIDVSIYQPIFSLQILFVTLLAFLLLGERFQSIIYFAVALAIIGTFLISYSDKFNLRDFFKNQGIMLMFVGIMFFAFSDIAAKYALLELDPWNFKAWSLIFFAIIFSPAILFAKDKKVNFQQLSPLILNNLFLVTAHVLIYYAFLSNVTVSQSLAMFGGLFTLIIAFLLQKRWPHLLENHTKKVYLVRSIGVIVLILSAIIIVIS